MKIQLWSSCLAKLTGKQEICQGKKESKCMMSFRIQQENTIDVSCLSTNFCRPFSTVPLPANKNTEEIQYPSYLMDISNRERQPHVKSHWHALWVSTPLVNMKHPESATKTTLEYVCVLVGKNV